MKMLQEIGRKACPRCGAHRIMRFPADTTCPVCGISLESTPVTVKKQGCLQYAKRA